MLEPVGRGIGRRKNFDSESVEQGARTEFRCQEFLGDLVVDPERGVGVEHPRDTKDLLELIVEPRRCRRSPKEKVVFTEQLPDLPRVSFDVRRQRFRCDAVVTWG